MAGYLRRTATPFLPTVRGGGSAPQPDAPAEEVQSEQPTLIRRGRLRMDRAVGVVVLALAMAAGAMLWLALALSGPERRTPPGQGLLFQTWRFLYDTQAPAAPVLLMAVAVALFFAAAVAVMERTIATRYRRSHDSGETPLAPKVVMEQTYGVYHGPVTVTVLIPAHNEEDKIAATLRSLQEHDDPPDRIIVVADNCTDGTADLARAAGVEVVATVDNTKKKAGALNQVLARILPDLGENDTVMVMDADTVLDRGYLAAARRRMTDDRALMAVGGLFYGEDGAGLLGQFQRNEYTRYSREIARRRGRVFVLTGTASMFRSRALKTIADSRGTLLPGHHGDVYDTEALTEDNELTIALKSLGALMASPDRCRVVTEVMPTWRALWHQRLRWQRGALENLGAYGVTPQTVRYWAQQLGIGYGVLALSSYLLLAFVMAVSLDQWVWFPFWIGVGTVFAVERVVAVWRSTWQAKLVAALLFPELLYAMFLNVVYVKGVYDIMTAKKAQWGHVVRDAGGGVVVKADADAARA
ncbi:MAG TPA: glycosyltransferase family 2 protein [Actinomycetota bacterium]|nr:glycosyltransferase family 2 protein [Actinomycetota bacterium]